MTRIALRLRHAALVLALTVAAPAPALAQSSASPATQVQAPVTILDGGIRRDLARGVYEARYSTLDQRLYVASAESVAGVKGGVIYQLDPVTLQTVGMIHTDKKNFALTFNAQGDTLFVTNSVQASITAIDVKSGNVKARLSFEDKASDGTPYGPRQIIHDPSSDLLYIGGVGAPGLIWVVDAKTLTRVHTIGEAGKWVTGLLVDPDQKRLYAANGDGEILVIDTTTYQIVSRWKPGAGREALLLNLALDGATHRLFVTDHSKLKTTLVLDSRTGKVIQTLPGGDAMGVKLNPVRNELYITHRDQGTLSILDSTTYALKKTIDLPVNPNSLALDPTGQVLYVTVKAPCNKDYTASADESVARIDLKTLGR